MNARIASKPSQFNRRIEGKILVPLILWWLGVPAGVVLILWILFF